MRWTGVTRKEVTRGSEHLIGFARTLLGKVQARIDGSNGLLQQYQIQKRFADGTIVTATSIFGDKETVK